MPQSAPCVKCGSLDIIPGVRVMDRGDYDLERDLRLRVDGDRNALLFTGTERCTLEARVCGACGNAEFYATDPATLFEAWRRSRNAKKE